MINSTPSKSNHSSISMDVVSPTNRTHITAVKELVWEYFCWGNSISIARNGYNFNIQQMYLNFCDGLDYYREPEGILYLIRNETTPIGTGGYKQLNHSVCELKRMYIREQYRKNGLGYRLLSTLLRKAKDAGFSTMKLETARFMEDACAMYLQFGFREIPIYNEVESPEEYRSIILCMEYDLNQSAIAPGREIQSP